MLIAIFSYCMLLNHAETYKLSFLIKIYSKYCHMCYFLMKIFSEFLCVKSYFIKVIKYKGSSSDVQSFRHIYFWQVSS